MAVFGVLGGDRRQLYLARSLEGDGHTLFLHGLEGLEGAAAKCPRPGTGPGRPG